MRIRIFSILFFSILGLMAAAQLDSSFLPAHPYLPLQKPAIYMLVEYHEKESKDALFMPWFF